jgi:excisionase family DNA binding protein
MKATPAARPAAGDIWYSPREAGRAVQIGRRTIYRAIKLGQLRAAEVNGRDLRIASSWLYAWMDARAAVPHTRTRGAARSPVTSPAR